MKIIKSMGINAIMFEPALHETKFSNSRVLNDVNSFKKVVDVIIRNRIADALENVTDKVHKFDPFSSDCLST